MIEKICTLDVQGEYFESETRLNFFAVGTNRCGLVFGRNGCGKSTVSRAIFQQTNPSIPTTFLVNQWLDDQGNALVLSDADKQRIFVFNEDFIDRNLKLSEDKNGMHAIVLFGKAGRLDDQILNLVKRVKDEEGEIGKRNVGFYHDSSNPNSLEKQKDGIKSSLQNGWAIRDQQIKKLLRRAPVTETIIQEIIKLQKPDDPIEILKSNFEKVLRDVSSVDSSKEPLSLIDCPLTSNTDNSLAQSLNLSFELESQDQLVLSILASIEKFGTAYVDFAHDNLPNESVCPVCFQPISLEHKAELQSAIEQVLNNETERAKAKLISMKMSPFSYDPSPYVGIVSKDTISRLGIACKVYNDVVLADNVLIDKKTQNIRKSLNVSLIQLDPAKKAMSDAVAQLNKEISEHNDVINNLSKALENIHLLNKQIAFYETQSQRDAYSGTLAAEAKDLAEDAESRKIIQSCQTEINSLNQKKKDYSIALSEINRELACIFSSKTRLFLSGGSDPSKYYINSNGRPIRLDKLSVGERNIIGLCYFFEDIKKNCREGDYFASDSLVVLDDPISSFDFENKLGIYSYLKGVLTDILHNNQKSKIIVFSHELDVIIATGKVIGDINEGKAVCRRFSFGNQVVDLNIRTFSNYSSLLESTLAFANSSLGAPESDVMGNIIRKALEAYANFNYRCSMDDFLSQPAFLAKISDEGLRAYFQKRMYRLVLNAASHTQDVAHQIPDIDQFDQFSPEEQKLTAKEVLVFLYCLDPEHIRRHFSNDSGAIKTIEQWKKETKQIIQ
jgi:wobble nucleotide-excising tRNase